MSKHFIYTGATMLALVSMSVQAGGDYAAGEKKAKEVCVACHAVDGNAPAGFPKIGGQWETYIHAALRQYKSGQRKNPIMGPQALNLTEQEMLDMATYYSQQKPVLFVIPRD